MIAKCKKGEINGKQITLCVRKRRKFTKTKLKKSYAPISVVENVPVETESFVELDYFKKTCINVSPKDRHTVYKWNKFIKQR